MTDLPRSNIQQSEGINLTSGQIFLTSASTTQVKKYLETNPIVRDEFIKNPIGELDKVVKEASAPAYYHDKFIYRYVVQALGLALLIAIVGSIWLALSDKTIPDLLVAISSGTIGALAGLFSATKSS